MQKLRAATIEQKRVIPAKPAEVYRVIADPEIHSAFTGARATGRARKGAKFTAWDGYIMGKTLIAEPGERLVQEWWTTGWPEDSTPSRLESRMEVQKASARDPREPEADRGSRISSQVLAQGVD